MEVGYKHLPPITNEQRSKGGVKSGEARRKKRTIAETMMSQLEAPLTDEKLLNVLRKSGLPMPEEPKYKDLVAAQTIMNVMQKGKPDDILKVMEIIGEFKPTQAIELETKDIKINITTDDG